MTNKELCKNCMWTDVSGTMCSVKATCPYEKLIKDAKEEERKEIIKWFNDCFVNDNRFNWWKFEKMLKKPIKEMKG